MVCFMMNRVVKRKIYMNKLLEEILNTCRKFTKSGEVASYIPELKKAD